MHTHLRGAALLLVLLTASLWTLGACQEEEPPPEPKVEPPLVPVQLPSIPADLGQSANPARLPDGSLTLEGLRRDRLAWLDKEIQISGILVHIYDCPYDDEKKPKRRKGEEPDPNEPLCQRPHFYVADTATAKADERLLVVGVSNELEEQLQKGELKIGERYVMRGTYADLGAGFAAPDQGLLVLGVVVGFEPKEKP